jgi:hypothetical protein
LGGTVGAGNGGDDRSDGFDAGARAVLRRYRVRAGWWVAGGLGAFLVVGAVVGVAVVRGELTTGIARGYLLPMLVVGGLGAVAVGVSALLRSRRQASCLRRATWTRVRVVQARFLGGSGARALPHGYARQFFVIRGEGGDGQPFEQVLTLASALIFGQLADVLEGAEWLEVAGAVGPSRYVVVRIEPGWRLYSALKPRSARGERRWLAMLAKQR